MNFSEGGLGRRKPKLFSPRTSRAGAVRTVAVLD
jgi:hypothetical protein